MIQYFKKILNAYNSTLLTILNTFILPSDPHDSINSQKENETLLKPNVSFPTIPPGRT